MAVQTNGEEHQLKQEDVMGTQPSIGHVRVAIQPELGVEE